MDPQFGTGPRVARPSSNVLVPTGSRSGSQGTAVSPGQVITATGKIPVPPMQKPRVRMNGDGSYTVSGVDAKTWFGPLQPLAPQAQDPALGAIGRRFDYWFAYNTQYTPRAEEPVGFQHLRMLADGYDNLRLVIETRKDQMEAQDWNIQPRDKNKDTDVKAITEFFRYPDKEHTYCEWQRMLLEDAFVLDALCIYPRPDNGGKLWSLDPVDGSTIKPLLDATGRRPAFPNPAYQQIIKGVVAADYNAFDLIYKPRNPRTQKAYGYSPVEQIITTVNIALRRQLFQLSYYTEGSIPDAFCSVPEAWTPAQLNEFQDGWDAYFNNELAGNSASRRRMKFIPGGVSDMKFGKEAVLKDEYDEWLARIVCYAFSVEPTPFVKQMNRATAENQKQQSRSEGLIPLKKWWKGLMDYIITFYLQRPDLEFAWMDEEAIDPTAQSAINTAYVKEGILTRDEVREDLGREPLQKGMGAIASVQTTDQSIEAIDPESDMNNKPPPVIVPPGAPPAPGEDPAKPDGQQPPAKDANPKDAKQKEVPDQKVKAAAEKFAKAWLAAELKTLAKRGKDTREGDPEAAKLPFPDIVRGVGIPYVAAINETLTKIYGDERLDTPLKLSSGDLDPMIPCAVHEWVEGVLVKVFGWAYDPSNKDEENSAHGYALRAEHACVVAQGHDPHEYEDLMAPIDEACYEAAKAGEMTDIPDDVARYSYRAEGEESLLDDAKKITKAAKTTVGRPINRDRKAVKIQTERLTRSIKRRFRAQAKTVSDWLPGQLGKLGKADGSMPSVDDELDRLLGSDDLWSMLWDDWQDVVESALQRTSADAVNESTTGLPRSSLNVGFGQAFVDNYSLEYAATRGAEMVGKKLVDGELVDNPDARWAITDETRNGIRSIVENALKTGESAGETAKALAEAYAFSPGRAAKIARTEVAKADSEGHLAGWKQSSVVVGKQWITAHDDLVSEECAANGEAGTIGMDDDFPSGDGTPPAHPNCRCAIAPVTSTS